jgi:serine/threonine-protein kinase
MKDLPPERWQQIDTLFAEALDRPPDERSAFLRHACGDDPDLYHAVSQLLDEMDAAAQMLGESVTDFAAPLMPELEADLRAEDVDEVSADRRIGPYRVVRPIGHGGMGTVYLAERADDQYRQQVALKLVRKGGDTQEIVHRFRYERQILASLEHPGIARLYDGGVSTDGRPYLVMEYVDGQPIDAYCDAHRLSVAARLELFEAVCEAVEYAHRNTVVHRDLKPSNILVTEEGRVKLLDFGIAKLVAEESTAPAAPQTRTGWRVMTPEYAAPEQVRGGSVTTATDVYALGGVLYELLTGRRPLDMTARSATEVEAAVLEQLPERPSIVVTRPITHRHRDATTATVAPDAVSAARGATPARLRRQLQGDLDVILLKALRKEPERRYASAGALLDDIRRHRTGQPIAARRDSVRYRAAKFVRRHRVGVGMALVAAVVLIGLGLFHTMRITQERDRAQAEAARAQAAMTFMETLFEGADPDETLGDTLTVFELLDRGTMQVGQALHNQPDVQATAQHILGTLYLKLGAYDQAAPLLQDAVAVQEAEENAATELLPHVNLAHLYVHTGAYNEADSLFQVGLARYRTAWGPRHANVASVLVDYGAALEEMGRYDKARTHLREALSIFEQASGDWREDMADARFALGTVYMNEGQYAVADSLFRAVLATRRVLYGATHSKVADALNNLGNSLYDQGEYAAADSLLQETLAIRRQLFGEDHPAVAKALNNLSLVPYARGNYAAADSLMRVSLGIVERLVGRVHPDAAMTLNNIGWVQLRQGDLDGAEATFRESLRIMQKVSGPVSPDAALLLGNVGFVLHTKGDVAAAEPFFREALAVRQEVHGPENMHVAWRQFALAEALRDLERYDEAETLHRESVAIRRTLRPDGHFDIARGLNGLAGALADQGKHAAAADAYREALSIYQTLYDPNHDTVVQVQGALGASLTAMGHFEEAEPLLLQHYETLTASKGADHADTHAAIERLAALYAAWERSGQAASYRALLEPGS